MKFVIKQTKEFNKWYVKQSLKVKAQVSDRVDRLQKFGHMGNTKALGSSIFEFKWKEGLRVYFTFLENKIVLLLNGGNKNGQKKDIERAKKIKNKHLT